MTDERLTWNEVRPELHREYEAHDGYLPHHAEREWAPRMGIKPNSLRTRFTNDLRAVCDEHWGYRLTTDDLAMIQGVRTAFAAYERLRSAGRPVPPFPAFVQALWSDIRPEPAVMEAMTRRCWKCQQHEQQWKAARSLARV